MLPKTWEPLLSKFEAKLTERLIPEGKVWSKNDHPQGLEYVITSSNEVVTYVVMETPSRRLGYQLINRRYWG